MQVQELLDSPDVDSIAGHQVERDAEGNLVAISLDPGYKGERYFVPAAVQPEPLSILHLGQFANDLAIGEIQEEIGEIGAAVAEGEGGVAGASEGEVAGATDEVRGEDYGQEGYEAFSAAANLLVLVQRLERDPEEPSRLRPSRPVSALARAVTFLNQQPMELGCHYGAGYWESPDARP